MSITVLLSEIERLDRENCENSDTEKFLKKPALPTERLLCVDGVTTFQTPADIAEFMNYGTSWSLCSIQLEWPNLREMRSILKNKNIKHLIESDFNKGLLMVDGAKKNNSIIFSYDYLPSIFQRAYFVFSDPDKYFIIDAGSEICRYDNIKQYLQFWKDVIIS